jgi:hypothetical protein
MACQSYFQETHGTPLHGKRLSPDQLVWAIGALAEGLGIRAVARVFEVDPNTVLQWLVEAADHLQAFSRHFLHNLHVDQVQLDELYALLSAVRAGEVSAAEAIKQLSRSPHWVWGALDPVTKLLLTIDVGDRTLAMAQCVVHQVVEVLAPGCVPLFLTDGFKEYATALLAHYGTGCSPNVDRRRGRHPSSAGCPCRSYSMRRSSNGIGADAWSVYTTESYLARWLGSRRCWPLKAGRSTPPSLNVSTSPFANMCPRWDGVS